MEGGENGIPVRIVVASVTTGKCILNTYITTNNLHVLKTESLCRLVACVSNIFDGIDNNNNDNGGDNSLQRCMASFLELDQLWVYVKRLIPQQMFVALLCTPGYTKSNAEVVLSIILNALLRAFQNVHVLNDIKTICEKCAKDSEKYTANSSMSTKSIEPVTITGLATLENNILVPILKQHFEYGLGWYDSFFNSIPKVTSLIIRLGNYRELGIHTPNNMKQKYKIIHRINVQQKHAVCININIDNIISGIAKEGEEMYTNVYEDITSTKENKLQLWCIKLYPSPFYIILVVDNEMVGVALPLEKLNVIIETCKARMKNAYDKLHLNNATNNNINKDDNNSNGIIIQSKRAIGEPQAITVNKLDNNNKNLVRIMELQEQDNDITATSTIDRAIGIQPKPPPRREKTGSPKNASIRVSRTTLKEVSLNKIEQDLPGVQIITSKGSATKERVEVKLMSTIGGSAVGSGARAVAQQMKN